MTEFESPGALSVKDQVMGVLDGESIAIAAANAVLRVGEGDR
jgi:hypothetical protein